jgi:NADH-quinone oxidoreductase subunit E
MMELEQSRSKIEEVVKKHPPEQRHALAILQDLQKEFNYIPKEGLQSVAEYLEIPLSKIYGIATFYRALSLKPRGKFTIKVCDGTACHISSSPLLIQEIERILGIKPGETTDDGLFSLETVNCLGSCAIAPVVVINDKYYGKVTPAKLRETINTLGGDKNAE